MLSNSRDATPLLVPHVVCDLHLAGPAQAPRPRRVTAAPQTDPGPGPGMQLTVDLLNPSAESEARKHKLKRLVQSPNSYFLPSEKFSLGDILGEAGKTANGFLFDPDFDFQETGEEWSDTVSARGDDEIAVDPDPYYDTPAFPTEDAPSEEGGGLFGGGGLGGMFGAFHTWTAEPDTPSFRLNDALDLNGLGDHLSVSDTWSRGLDESKDKFHESATKLFGGDVATKLSKLFPPEGGDAGEAGAPAQDPESRANPC